MAAVAATFAGYPDEVVEPAIIAIARRSDRLTLRLITAVCDEIHAPMLREIERRRAAEQHRRGLPPPAEKRTPEQQARIDALVAETRRALGIPEDGHRRGHRPVGCWGDAA